MSNHDPIRWNKEKKAKRDAEIESQATVTKQEKAKKLAGRMFEDWKRHVKKTCKTSQDVLDQLVSFRENLLLTFKGEGIDDWLDFTTDLLKTKLNEAVAVNVIEKNQIVQYIPQLEGVAKEESALPVKEQGKLLAQTVEFRTEEQLLAIPWVRRVVQSPKFVGLLLDKNALVGFFDDGEIIQIGFVTNGVGLEKIHTLDAYRAALGRN